MIELPDEIWGYIKEFVFDWKQTHKLNMESTLTHMIPNIFGPIYERWTHFPPYPNTNDIIRVQPCNHFEKILHYFFHLINTREGLEKEYKQNINQSRLICGIRERASER